MRINLVSQRVASSTMDACHALHVDVLAARMRAGIGRSPGAMMCQPICSTESLTLPADERLFGRDNNE